MRRLARFILAIALNSLLLACGGAKQMTQENATPALVKDAPPPAWFSNLPQEENYILAAATATSKDLQLAINKAKQTARADIGAQVEARMQTLTKQFQEEIGKTEGAQLDADFAEVSKTVVSLTLKGCRTREQITKPEGQLWRAYVLMEYPIGAAKTKFVEAIKEHEPLRQKIVSTEGFKELDAEVKKFALEKERKTEKN